MSQQSAVDRLREIDTVLSAMSGWAAVQAEIDRKTASYIEQLVNQNNEELRGRIKALQLVRNLPETLASERESMSAALSEQDAAR